MKIYLMDQNILHLLKEVLKEEVAPRVRVISSNVVQNYLINQQLPNSFNKTSKPF